MVIFVWSPNYKEPNIHSKYSYASKKQLRNDMTFEFHYALYFEKQMLW